MNAMTDKCLKDLFLRPPRNIIEWNSIYSLRNRALFDGNAMKYSKYSNDEAPDQQVYVLIVRDQIIGTLRMDFSHHMWVALRLVAVEPEWRGFGYGAEMLRIAEDFVRNKGRSDIRVHAKQNAIGFYRCCGFFKVEWEELPRDPNAINMGKGL